MDWVNKPSPFLAGRFSPVHVRRHSTVLPPRPPVDGDRIIKEVMVALGASALVSPLVSIIDKAIIKQVVGVRLFAEAMREGWKSMTVTPRSFFLSAPFIFTYGVYAGTYLAANLSEVWLDYKNERVGSVRKTTKVGVTSVANISLLAARDAYLAKLYSGVAHAGSAAKKAPAVPFRTLYKFAIRDAATMFATFYGAPQFSRWLLEEGHVNTLLQAEVLGALTVPMAAQIVTAPIHILALDQYNRPVIDPPPSKGGLSRWHVIQMDLPKVIFARVLRVIPAFGLGSFMNTRMRRHFVPGA